MINSSIKHAQPYERKPSTPLANKGKTALQEKMNMWNEELVSNYLQKTGRYPLIMNESSDGFTIKIEEDRLFLSGNPDDLIALADLLVSLALSGKNRGQHWHIDKMTLISETASIDELILERKDTVV